MGKFEEDLEAVYSKIAATRRDPLNGRDLALELESIKRKLLALWRRRLVKSNHTIMELVVAGHLLYKGYRVDVEVEVGEGLVCDIYARNDSGSLIVEVETGFVPPDHSSDPILYRAAREASKIARYSRFADEFALAVPPYHVLQVPEVLYLDPEDRDPSELALVKDLLDAYYSRPPVELEDIARAKLSSVYVVNVDRAEVLELSAKEYCELFIRPLLALPIAATSASI